MSKHHDHPHDDIYDLGLSADLNMWLKKPLERRRVLQLGAASIGLLLTGCVVASQEQTNDTCVTEIPAETEGPFPADGSRGVNVLDRSGIIRQDIRTSLETGMVAGGVPLTVNLQLLGAGGDCAPLVGYALYLWHCDREGRYSMYSSGVEGEDYLRGVQATDSEGNLSFTSIFPACYPGRWPHLHFEVYPSLDVATSAANVVHTSQIAFPQDVCEAVYGSAEGYQDSIGNLAQLALETDGIFRDGVDEQLATVKGSVEEGYTAELTFGVEV